MPELPRLARSRPRRARARRAAAVRGGRPSGPCATHSWPGWHAGRDRPRRRGRGGLAEHWDASPGPGPAEPASPLPSTSEALWRSVVDGEMAAPVRGRGQRRRLGGRHLAQPGAPRADLRPGDPPPRRHGQRHPCSTSRSSSRRSRAVGSASAPCRALHRHRRHVDGPGLAQAIPASRDAGRGRRRRSSASGCTLRWTGAWSGCPAIRRPRRRGIVTPDGDLVTTRRRRRVATWRGSPCDSCRARRYRGHVRDRAGSGDTVSVLAIGDAADGACRSRRTA